jgi:hypothetical protein
MTMDQFSSFGLGLSSDKSAFHSSTGNSYLFGGQQLLRRYLVCHQDIY